MIIPAEQLSRDALQGLMESFITREGTDYGAYEVSLDEKVQQVHRSILGADVLIIYDAATESVNLMTRQQYQEWLATPADNGLD